MSNRRQPIRQTRTNPARNATNARTLGGSAFGAQQEPPQPDIAPGFFPGIMHFTDSITALPKEMVRHYTMLKEVEAKMYHPEEALKKLVVEGLKGPPPPPQNALGQKTAQGSLNDHYDTSGTASGAIDQDDLNALYDRPHRELHMELRVIANNMLVTLDEKNHVLGNATDHLERLLSRCDSSWPAIEGEISENTRIGNLDHWAYTNNATTEKKASANEARPRREAAHNNLAALANTADLEGKYDGRTVLGSRKHRLPQNDSDFDEPRPGKRTVAGKGKKPEYTSAPNIAGLGITNGIVNKKRKIEKTAPAVGGQAMDRSASSLYGNSTRGAGSPRDTPALEATKKRSRNTGGALAAAVQGRKRAGTANSTTNSPNLASSPVAGSFNALPKGTNSPALGAAMQRTSSTRARQNSTHTSQPARPPSTAAKEANGNSHGAPVDSLGAPKLTDSKSGKHEEIGNNDVGTRSSGRSSDRSNLKREESTNSRPRPPSIATGARNNGKASKTATPVAASFPDPTRPRSGRNTSAPSLAVEPPPKRSHKKGGGIGAQAAAAAKAAAEAAKAAVDDENNSDAGEEEEPAEGEPLYCYCQKVSYGEMIGCDWPKCKREWFHLGCVGLDKVPGKNETWYCKDCAPLAARRR